ncbi:MAG TPA: nitrogenase [Methanosarcinales archaeon]|nr:nitrogenase [Methanosarcinales archaeon]
MTLIYDPPQDCKLVGALRAIHGVRDSITIIHAKPGCHCGMLLLKALGSNQNDVRVISSGFRSHDTVYGAEKRLSAAIQLSQEYFEPGLIAALNCSAPAIMGDDIEGVASSMEEKIPAALMTIATGGYEGPAWIGYEEALVKLTDYMIPVERPSANKVNLIGIKTDDISAAGDLTEIRRILKGHGIAVNTVLADASFDEIKNAPDASLNVVLGGDGLECANVMRERFDTPYIITPYPFGVKKTTEFIELVANRLGREIGSELIDREIELVREGVERVCMFLQGIYDMPVAVIGESGRAFDLAEFLSDELGLNVKVLAISSKNYLTPDRIEDGNGHFGDVFIEPDRFEMNDLIKGAGVSVIFGSTFEKHLSSEIGAPLIRVSYPVLDEVRVTDSPYAGFRGALHLCETIINSVITQNIEEIKE